MKETYCFHCGDHCAPKVIKFDYKTFCCHGCQTVYQILSENELQAYYDMQQFPGVTPKEFHNKYDFLSDQNIVDKLIEFDDASIQITTLYIPQIHCSACIWILENLSKINHHITTSQVNFGKKTVRITYNSLDYSLKDCISLLSSIGYEPYIALDSFTVGKKDQDRQLIYKLGLAGFAFGNVMFLSFPEYFEVGEYWLEHYKHVFRWLMFSFSIPTVVYAAQDYFRSAYRGLRSQIFTIDIPIALGIAVLFLRSTFDIIFDFSSGFFDSLNGLVFFLLLGKFFQQKTYAFLSFERDYKSYFPMAITKISSEGLEIPVQVYDIKKDDRLLIRHEELIPVDGILLSDKALIDYSFVTGESDPISKNSGAKILAGGKQIAGSIEMKVLKSVEQSYITQLWSNPIFDKNKDNSKPTITNAISKHFTQIIIGIALAASLFWFFIDSSKVLNVFTSVLIIACPCAIALSAPFTYGNLLRIFGKLKFYVKNSATLERLASVNTIIFDKTGTITSNKKSDTIYEGEVLTKRESLLLKNSLRSSNHQLSRALYEILAENDIVTLHYYHEYVGQGIEARYQGDYMKIGSGTFVGHSEQDVSLKTSVHISSNNVYKGKFVFYNQYRKGLSKLFNSLKKDFDLAILSGDNEGEYQNLKKLLPSKTKLIFNQTPEAKLQYIEYHQNEGANILMIGDGLNDAGALAQSNVGIAISEDINVFSPACDAILDASQFGLIDQFIRASKYGKLIIKWSFLFSFMYNVIGLYFAVRGELSPIVAAILMPLSSISIVCFTTVMTWLISKFLFSKMQHAQRQIKLSKINFQT